MKIPVPVIAVVSDVLARNYTHNRLDFLMEQAGLTGDPPFGNKVDKARAWLKRANTDSAITDPLSTLGRALEEFMEVDSSGYGVLTDLSAEREQINAKLAEHSLAYLKGGHVVRSGLGVVSRSVEDIIRTRDLAALQSEFDRIFENIERDPPAAVTASCALLESLFKLYIADERLTMPADESIKPLWNVVRKDLKLDPVSFQDEDLKKILSGLASIVDGTAGLRTHKGSAHGQGRKTYKVEPRHARLTAHSALTLAMFILETWDKRQTRRGSS
ncbi:MAG TPA: abortive infection family protein [Terriglobales bacterium]|nr:abortive infection family protein [Terriglobales bacterium]